MKARNALLLDLDGTLVDTAPDICASLNATLVAFGRSKLDTESVRHMVGDGLAKLLERGFAATGDPASPAQLKESFDHCLAQYTAEPTRLSQPFPGVAEVLTNLRKEGWKLGVCTNKPEALSRTVLSNLDLLDLMDAVVGGDSLPVKKPDAGHPLATLQQMGAKAEESIFIGDSINDLLAGRAAGMPVVLVTFGYTARPAKELGADHTMDHFAELPGLLANL